MFVSQDYVITFIHQKNGFKTLIMDTNYNAYNYLKAIGHNWANEKYNPLLYYIKEAIEHGFKQSK